MVEMAYPHLNQAPIIEALIDIQCLWGDDLTHDKAIQKLEDAIKPLKSEFPIVETQMMQQIAFKPDPSQTAVTGIANGFLLRAEGSPYAIQFRRNGFTFSRLTPYQSWKDLSENAQRHWKIYVDLLGKVSVTRLAVRYINRVQVPFPLSGNNDLIKNLRQPLTQPSDFSEIVSFVDQTVSHDSSSGAFVGFVRAMQQIPAGATVADVVLDIDVFRTVAGLGGGDQAVWELIEGFHDVKNRVFFDCIGASLIAKYR